MKKILLAASVIGGFFLTACNPNEDIYNKLDDAKLPYAEQNVAYILQDADYSLAGNATVTANKAFSNTEGSDTLIPKILAKKFLALKLNSTMDISYNYISRNVAADPTVQFGYEFTDADYQSIPNATVNTTKTFNNGSSSTTKSTLFLPNFLLSKYPSAADKDTQNVVLKNNYTINLERYVFNGTTWSRLNYVTEFAKIGYTLVSDDYILMQGDVAYRKNFSATVLPDNYLPAFLKVKYPFAVAGTVKFVKYKFFVNSSLTEDRVDQYKYNGSTLTWVKIQKTDKFIFSSTGWIYDPAIRFTLTAEDYLTILKADTKKDNDADITKASGYEFGSSYHNNISFNTPDWLTYNPALFTGMTDDQIKAKIVEQVKLGMIVLLQKNYPNATPLVKGVDSFYFLTFATYKGTASKLTWKFQCTAAGSPATFVFVEAVQ